MQAIFLTLITVVASFLATNVSKRAHSITTSLFDNTNPFDYASAFGYTNSVLNNTYHGTLSLFGGIGTAISHNAIIPGPNVLPSTMFETSCIAELPRYGRSLAVSVKPMATMRAVTSEWHGPDSTYPFSWVHSAMNTVIALISNGFRNSFSATLWHMNILSNYVYHPFLVLVEYTESCFLGTTNMLWQIQARFEATWMEFYEIHPLWHSVLLAMAGLATFQFLWSQIRKGLASARNTPRGHMVDLSDWKQRFFYITLPSVGVKIEELLRWAFSVDWKSLVSFSWAMLAHPFSECCTFLKPYATALCARMGDILLRTGTDMGTAALQCVLEIHHWACDQYPSFNAMFSKQVRSSTSRKNSQTILVEYERRSMSQELAMLRATAAKRDKDLEEIQAQLAKEQEMTKHLRKQCDMMQADHRRYKDSLEAKARSWCNTLRKPYHMQTPVAQTLGFIANRIENSRSPTLQDAEIRKLEEELKESAQVNKALKKALDAKKESRRELPEVKAYRQVQAEKQILSQELEKLKGINAKLAMESLRNPSDGSKSARQLVAEMNIHTMENVVLQLHSAIQTEFMQLIAALIYLDHFAANGQLMIHLKHLFPHIPYHQFATQPIVNGTQFPKFSFYLTTFLGSPMNSFSCPCHGHAHTQVHEQASQSIATSWPQSGALSGENPAFANVSNAPTRSLMLYNAPLSLPQPSLGIFNQFSGSNSPAPPQQLPDFEAALHGNILDAGTGDQQLAYEDEVKSNLSLGEVAKVSISGNIPQPATQKYTFGQPSRLVAKPPQTPPRPPVSPILVPQQEPDFSAEAGERATKVGNHIFSLPPKKQSPASVLQSAAPQHSTLFAQKKDLGTSNSEYAWNNLNTSKVQAPQKAGPFYEEDDDDHAHYGKGSSSGKRTKSTHADADRGMSLFEIKKVDSGVSIQGAATTSPSSGDGFGPNAMGNGGFNVAGRKLEDWEKVADTPLPSFSGLSFGNSRPVT